ncbi:hypothetical protein [Polaromonas naphthalenivorans]|uniref:hypothetical protein n=1 Tax=Polaromonas naphthalenivorans TaxID=216465 RepID=UPI0002DDE21B|nr:hypothetical protein [Polaromonas naphthalenivorans]
MLTSAELDGAPSLNAKLRIAQDAPLEVCYAPFDYIITPLPKFFCILTMCVDA